MRIYVTDEFDFSMVKSLVTNNGSLNVEFSEITQDEFVSEYNNHVDDIVSSITAQTSTAINTKLNLTIVPNKKTIRLNADDVLYIVGCSKTLGTNRKYLTTISFYKIMINV